MKSMKKTVGAQILICVMLLTCIASANTATKDFGDFSIDLDPGMPCQENQKAESAVLFVLYPAYNAIGDTATNFNAVWSSNVTDLTTYRDSDREVFTRMLEGEITAQYQAVGFTMTDFSVSDIGLLSIGGKPALVYQMTYSLANEDYSGSLIQRQAVVSDPAFGTYTFTGTAKTPELMETYLASLFEAISWN